MVHTFITPNGKFKFIPNIGWILDKTDTHRVSIVNYSPNGIVGANLNELACWFQIGTIDYIHGELRGRVLGPKHHMSFQEAKGLATPFNGSDKHVNLGRMIGLSFCHLPPDSDNDRLYDIDGQR